MSPAVDRLLDLLLEAGRMVERIELTEADARALVASPTANSLQTFRYDGRLYHRGIVVEAGDRSRIVTFERGERLAYPLPEKVAL